MIEAVERLRVSVSRLDSRPLAMVKRKTRIRIRKKREFLNLLASSLNFFPFSFPSLKTRVKSAPGCKQATVSS